MGKGFVKESGISTKENTSAIAVKEQSGSSNVTVKKGDMQGGAARTVIVKRTDQKGGESFVKGFVKEAGISTKENTNAIVVKEQSGCSNVTVRKGGMQGGAAKTVIVKRADQKGGES